MFRNSLLILLIFLLPIRSWASESMGLKMAESTHSMEIVTEGDFSHCETTQTLHNKILTRHIGHRAGLSKAGN